MNTISQNLSPSARTKPLRKKVTIAHGIILIGLLIGHFFDWSFDKKPETIKVKLFTPPPPSQPKTDISATVTKKVEPKPAEKKEVVKKEEPKTVVKKDPPKKKDTPKKQTTRKKKKKVADKPKKKKPSLEDQMARIRGSIKKEKNTVKPQPQKKIKLPKLQQFKTSDLSKGLTITPKRHNYSNTNSNAIDSNELSRYSSKLHAYLKSRWRKPSSGRGLKVRVNLFIKRDGTLTVKKIVNKSGHTPLDASIQALLAELRKVPALNSKLGSSLDIDVTFRLDN